MELGISYVLAMGAACLMGVSLLCLGLRVCRTGKAAVTPEQITEARKNKRVLEELVRHPGWKLLNTWGEAQVAPRRNKVLLEPTSQPYEQEFTKGEIQGIELMLKIPVHLIDEATAIIALDVEGSNADSDE